jgi:hypothetical protein
MTPQSTFEAVMTMIAVGIVILILWDLPRNHP